VYRLHNSSEITQKNKTNSLWKKSNSAVRGEVSNHEHVYSSTSPSPPSSGSGQASIPQGDRETLYPQAAKEQEIFSHKGESVVVANQLTAICHCEERQRLRAERGKAIWARRLLRFARNDRRLSVKPSHHPKFPASSFRIRSNSGPVFSHCWTHSRRAFILFSSMTHSTTKRGK